MQETMREWTKSAYDPPVVLPSSKQDINSGKGASEDQKRWVLRNGHNGKKWEASSVQVEHTV